MYFNYITLVSPTHPLINCLTMRDCSVFDVVLLTIKGNHQVKCTSKFLFCFTSILLVILSRFNSSKSLYHFTFYPMTETSPASKKFSYESCFINL